MQLRACQTCGVEKPLDDFYIRRKMRGKEVYLPYNSCKVCAIKKATERGSKKEKRCRKHLDAYKLRVGCSMCGYKEAACALDFHHTDKNKHGGVASMLTNKLSTLMLEVRKCIVVCANCHRVLHKDE